MQEELRFVLPDKGRNGAFSSPVRKIQGASRIVSELEHDLE